MCFECLHVSSGVVLCAWPSLHMSVWSCGCSRVIAQQDHEQVCSCSDLIKGQTARLILVPSHAT